MIVKICEQMDYIIVELKLVCWGGGNFYGLLIFQTFMDLFVNLFRGEGDLYKYLVIMKFIDKS